MGALNPLVATACNAALASWGALTLALSPGGFGTGVLAAYATAYGALNLWLIFGGARRTVAAGRGPWVHAGGAALSASLPLVFLGLALADRGAPLEWAGAALMALPAWMNWRAIRRAAGEMP